MRTATKVKCNACGKHWKHYSGFGFTNIYYYCDKCGKKKTAKNSFNHGLVVDLSSEFGLCKCGGTFRMHNETVLCPTCHVPAEDISDINILWD